MAQTLKQIYPLVDYKGPGGWRVADPESGQLDPTEEPTDTHRRLRWATAGKTVVFSTAVNGKITNFPPQDLTVDAQSPVQKRSDGGWFDMYAYEVV